ncbi:MAG: ATP-binding protein, partial [Leptospiraceae bacterium]|nr:ATP-binding protein [Leptospiraceae bacterium]
MNLLETLSKELSSLISGAEEDMIQFETSFTSELLNSLFRKIHTIKGNSGMANLKKIERLSHSLEHILSKMRSNELAPSEEINQLIFDSIDRLKQMIFNLENESTVVVQDLVERLNLLEENKEKNSINIEPLTPYRELAISQECFLWNAEIYFPVNLFPTLASVISTLNQISQATLVKTPNWEKMQDSKTKGNLSFIWKVLFITEQEPQNYIATHSLIANNITLHYQPHKQEITQNLKSATSKESKDLRITSQNMEEMIELAKEIIITRNILAKKLNIREDTEEEFLFIKHTNLILQLHDKLIRNRLQKFHTILPRLQRMVRDISKSLKKEIDFEFKGGEVELDGMFMESLNECLLHMIRNAIDHGIEETQERILLGKNPKGTIKLTASLRSGNVQIEVEDDGRGIDLSKIKSRAVEKGLFDWQTLGQMSDSEVMEIIFRPGFSTSEKITDLSGRGVGMDVVLTNFRKFGGNIKIETFPGKGTKFIGSVPQIISSMPCAILRVLEEKFVILKKKILEFGFFKKENLEIFENKKVYKIREKLYPFLDLQEVFFPDVKEETPSGY